MTALLPSGTAAVGDYLAALGARGASPNTVSAYRGDLEQLTDYLGGGAGEVRWWRVRRASILAYEASLVAHGCATATVARKIASAKSFFRWLVASGALPFSPIADLPTPPVPQRRPPALDRAEVDALVTAPPRPLSAGLPRRTAEAARLRDAAMLRTLAGTGLRATELVDLDCDDVALDAGYLLAGRGGRLRTVPLDPRASAALALYLEIGRPFICETPTPALWLNVRGERISRQGFWLILKARASAAGLPRWVTTQSLRHALAVELLADHAPLADVAQLLGHASVATTSLYLEPGAAHQRRAS